MTDSEKEITDNSKPLRALLSLNVLWAIGPITVATTQLPIPKWSTWLLIALLWATFVVVFWTLIIRGRSRRKRLSDA